MKEYYAQTLKTQVTWFKWTNSEVYLIMRACAHAYLFSLITVLWWSVT